MLNFLSNILASAPGNLSVLTEIGIVIIIAAFFAFLARLFKQPLIPAYIITGILLGPLFLGVIKNPQLVSSLSEIGVAFLIFTAGLEIKFNKLKEVGLASSINGILQIVILFLIAFFISIWFGFAGKAPVYIGLAVAFSSTMVVVKILADRREINSLHGRIIVGILLVQDIVAIIALIALTSDLSLISISLALLKILILAGFAFVFSKISNSIFRFAANSPELLFLISISFLFLFVVGSVFAKLSIVIGAFFAGVTLANSDYKTEIEGRIIPLRNFFAVIFFVVLGMQIKTISRELFILFLVLVGLVIIIKPLIIMFSVRISGYKNRTSFLTGNALAQTSEFSLILAIVGLSLGQINQDLFSMIILLTVFTMSITSYFINYEKKLFNWFGWPLKLLDNFRTRNEELEYLGSDGNKIIIFGCHRMGSLFLNEFEKEKKDILAVDYDPVIIKSLIGKKIPCIYGDFMNEEIFNKINFKNTETIVSTIPNFEDNILLIKKAKKANKNSLVLVSARRISEALELYKAGADYVILPEVISGKIGLELIKKIKGGKIGIRDLKKEQIEYLNSIHNILY